MEFGEIEAKNRIPQGAYIREIKDGLATDHRNKPGF